PMRASLVVLITALTATVLTASGCGDDLGECPADSAARQAQGLEVLQTKCMTCHSSQVSGSARLGAPSDLNFDDPGTVQDNAGDMWSETDDGAMPPTGELSAEDKEALRVYLACTAQ
ncbi:MAG: cytochrome c, partial [Polyangiaceae bacterium]